MDENISDYSFLNTLVESMSSPVFFKDAKGVFQYCNHAFFEYLGLTKEQVIGHTVYDISPERLADIYYNADEELMNNRGRQTYEASVLYADGTLHDVLFNKAAVTDSNGSLKGLVGIMQDVTQKNEIDRRLFMMHKVKDIFIELNHSIFDFDDFTDLFKAMLEKLITVFEDCNQASVLEIDDSGFIRIICSAGYFKIDDSGFSMKAQDSLIWSYIDGNLGKISIINSNIQAADSKPADVYPIISNCPVASSVLIPVIKSGRTNWIITMDSCIRGRFNAKDLVVAEYIQEEMPILVRMLDLHHENIVFARFDHLTGMMNRGYFNTILEDRLEIARHSNEPMHFVSFDLNGLKKVNDSLGHLAGDIYIGAFARMLQGKIQKSDASGRVGGDEFACIFSNSSRNEILNLITDFQNEFKNLELRYGETTFRGSFSFGIASYGLDSCDKEKLLQIADQRMYENKAEQSI